VINFPLSLFFQLGRGKKCGYGAITKKMNKITEITNFKNQDGIGFVKYPRP
jgi:hypothetical protein